MAIPTFGKSWSTRHVAKSDTRGMHPNSTKLPARNAPAAHATIEVVRWVLLTIAVAACFATEPRVSLRGTLVQHDGQPAIETAGHKLVVAQGEPETLAVLNDKRLAGADVELLGNYAGPGHFEVGPFYTSTSIIVHKDGKRYTVSYWCPVCSIRAYTPGKCVCCQRETHLDLQEIKP
jgi:hypothetical protein